MPVAFSDSPQDLTSLMQDIIEVLLVIQIMIKNRIHKNDDINNLFQRVALKNTNLTQAQMESVFKLINYACVDKDHGEHIKAQGFVR